MSGKALDKNYRFKHSLLRQLGDTLYSTAMSKDAFNGGSPIATRDYEAVVGPRAGILLCSAGLHGTRLFNVLSRGNNAILRSLFSSAWQLSTDPLIYWRGNRLAIEAPWPDDIQLTRVVLDEEAVMRPQDGRSALLGLRQDYEFQYLQLNDRTESHTLTVGRTGSGKTVTLANMTYQFARGKQAQFVVMDGKGGPGSLSEKVYGLKHLVGPIAIQKRDALNAMGWVWHELNNRRYGHKECDTDLHIIVDEFQEFTQIPVWSQIAAQVGRMGRALRVHLHWATQRPDSSMWGDAGKALQSQFGVIILHTLMNHYDVVTVMGSSDPPATTLLGPGDAYVTLSGGRRERVQMALPTENDRVKALGAQPRLKAWPKFHTEDFNALDEDVEFEADRFTPEQMLAALKAATVYELENGQLGGRGTLQKLLDEIGMPEPGTDRARELLGLGREWNSKFDAILKGVR